MKIGIIASTGGSVFSTSFQLLKQCGFHTQFCVVTDRECGIEKFCIENDIPCRRIDYRDCSTFSHEACRWFLRESCDFVILTYTRKVGKELYEHIGTLNIHPSLLPAFQGMGAVRKAFHAGVRFLGASGHVVIEEFDQGAVINQVITPLPWNIDEQKMNKMSFLQKVHIFTSLIEMIELKKIANMDGKPVFDLSEMELSPTANPSLVNNRLRQEFQKLCNKEGMITVS